MMNDERESDYLYAYICKGGWWNGVERAWQGQTPRAGVTAPRAAVRYVQFRGMNQFPKTFSDEKVTLESWWENTTLL